MFSNILYFSSTGIVIFLFTFIILQVFAQDINFNQSNSLNLSTYQNRPFGFEINYPSNMELIEDNFLTSSYQQILTLFLEKKYKVPLISISVYFPFPNEKSLSDFLPRIIKDKSDPRFVNVNKTISIITNETSALDLQHAHKLEYYDNIMINNNNKTQTVETKNLDIWTFVNDIIYEIEYSGSEEKYNEYISTANKIIDSFKFTNIFK